MRIAIACAYHNEISVSFFSIFCCFFFQAEDGIRDGHVTGVQTCALPISKHLQSTTGAQSDVSCGRQRPRFMCGTQRATLARSEERRVGKEWRYRREAQRDKKERKDVGTRGDQEKEICDKEK